jgi:hypothetical protein
LVGEATRQVDPLVRGDVNERRARYLDLDRCVHRLALEKMCPAELEADLVSLRKTVG